MEQQLILFTSPEESLTILLYIIILSVAANKRVDEVSDNII